MSFPCVSKHSNTELSQPALRKGRDFLYLETEKAFESRAVTLFHAFLFCGHRGQREAGRQVCLWLESRHYEGQAGLA